MNCDFMVAQKFGFCCQDSEGMFPGAVKKDYTMEVEQPVVIVSQIGRQEVRDESVSRVRTF